MTEVANTGERILLEKESPMMIARHFCAYEFAKDYASGKHILDIGCGEGYGAHYLAGYAKDVVGVDYDYAIIDYASNKYRKENLAYYCIDIKELPGLKRKFDLICSFQVIEHIPEVQLYLDNIRKLLKDGGIFICSTVNKLDSSRKSDTPLNKFHVKEYLFLEFDGLLRKKFKNVGIFGLKRGRKLLFFRRLKKIGLFKFLPSGLDPVKKFYCKINCNDFRIVTDNLSNALDFIAVCR